MSELASRVFQEIATPSNVCMLGVLMVGFGLYLVNFNWIYRRLLSFRDEYARSIRIEGESYRSEMVRNDTRTLKRRVPIYGASIMIIGFGCIAAAIVIW